MTPDDRARLEAVAAQCERMGIDDLRTVPVEDPWALARAIRAALAEHVSREDREDAIQAALSSAAAYERGGGYRSYLAEARRLLKLEDA